MLMTISTQALYQRALKVRSAVPHPKIMGIIRECGGKMHMSEGKWNCNCVGAKSFSLFHRKLEGGPKRLLREFPEL